MPFVLILREQSYAQFWSVLIDRRRPNTRRQQTHPAGANVRAIYDCHNADVARLSPTFDVNANVRILKNFPRAQSGGRRIPQRDVEPIPELLLVVGSQWAKVSHAGSHRSPESCQRPFQVVGRWLQPDHDRCGDAEHTLATTIRISRSKRLLPNDECARLRVIDKLAFVLQQRSAQLLHFRRPHGFHQVFF